MSVPAVADTCKFRDLSVNTDSKFRVDGDWTHRNRRPRKLISAASLWRLQWKGLLIMIYDRIVTFSMECHEPD